MAGLKFWSRFDQFRPLCFFPVKCRFSKFSTDQKHTVDLLCCRLLDPNPRYLDFIGLECSTERILPKNSRWQYTDFTLWNPAPDHAAFPCLIMTFSEQELRENIKQVSLLFWEDNASHGTGSYCTNSFYANKSKNYQLMLISN